MLETIGRALLWLYGIAGGISNLIDVLVVVVIVVFGPGLWLAKRRREKEEREKLDRELKEDRLVRADQSEAIHKPLKEVQLTAEEEEALRDLE